MKTIADLKATLPQQGTLRWIGVRPERRAAMQSIETAQLLADQGIAGDRAARRKGHRRQISLLQFEHLDAIAAYAGVSACAQLLFGPLSDRYGRRPIILVGLVTFIFASVGCLLLYVAKASCCVT